MVIIYTQKKYFSCKNYITSVQQSNGRFAENVLIFNINGIDNLFLNTKLKK